MKKATTLWGFVALGLCMHGQILKHEYTFSNPIINGEGNQKTISVSNCMNKGRYGQPLLPWRTCNLALPEGSLVDRIVVTAMGGDTVSIEGILAPAGHVRPLSDYQNRHESSLDMTTYSKSIFLGQDYTNIQYKVHYLNGKPVLMFGLSPVRYNPLQAKLIRYQKIVIEVYGKSGTGDTKLLTHDVELLNTFIDNPVSLTKAPPQTGDVNTIDVLVITSEQYVSQIAALTANYHSRGKKTKVVTTQTIQNSYQGNDLAEKIRNCIKYYHEYKNARYVLLGGDVEIIPVRLLRAVAQSSQVYTGNIPSDLYYAALDGNWDTNGNGIFGEPNEADLLPEVAIGRIPFSNATELGNFITKATKYAYSPVISDTNRPLLIGEHLFDNPLTWGAQYLDMIVGLQTANGYTTQGIPPLDPYDSLYDRTQTWNTTQLRNKINQGSSFIHHVGHSNFNYNMRLYNSDLTNTYFSAINGTTRLNPLIYSHGCLAAAFDQSDCIAEKMIFLPNFTSGYVGNTRYGWFNEGQTEGPSAHQHREFVHALYGMQKQHLGICHQVSQLRTAAWVDLPFEYEPGAQRWVFYACNVLGDPVTPVWTAQPTSPDFGVVGEVFAGDNQLTINSSVNNPNLKIALIDGQNRLLGFVDSLVGTKILHIYPTIRVPATLYLVSSGRNIVPDTVPVNFQEPTAATLIFDGYTIVGSTNNYVVAGKPTEIKINLMNVGLTGATNCTAVVSALTPGVEVEGVLLNYGTVQAGQCAAATESISFQVPPTIPNNSNILFQIDLLLGNNIHHTDYFHIPVFAPILSFGQPVWNDVLGGNGNGVPERGEIIVLTVPVSNFGGAESDTIRAELSSVVGNFIIANGVATKAPLESLQTTEFIFLLQIAQDSEIGEIISAQISISGGVFTSSQVVSTRANLPVEEFAGSAFTLPVWTNNSPAPWTFSSGGLGGGFCMRSGTISHNQSTQISTSITLLQPDVISFWIKTSCEYSSSVIPYDFLEFVVGETTVGMWDNTPQWTKVTFTLPAGTHQLIWRYNKDGSVSSLQDAVWIDRVVFPPVFDIPANENAMPVIHNLTDVTIQAGQTLAINFTVSDEDNDSIAVSMLNNPTWLSLTRPAGQWQLSGIVPQNPKPEYEIQVVASDGNQATFQNVVLSLSNSSGSTMELINNTVWLFPNPAKESCVLKGLPPGQTGTIAFINQKGVCNFFHVGVSDTEGKIVIEKFGNMNLKGLYLLHYQFGTCKGTTVLLID